MMGVRRRGTSGSGGLCGGFGLVSLGCLGVIVSRVFSLVLSVAAMATAQTLTVSNGDGHLTTLSSAQIAGAAHVTVSADDHGRAAKFEGVPLSTVLAMAGVELRDTMRGVRLTEFLLVSAVDGYKVAFALAEADPAFATREIILADKRDGKLLDAKEGPFRVVAPGDKRSARWIRQVTDMKIVAVK